MKKGGEDFMGHLLEGFLLVIIILLDQKRVYFYFLNKDSHFFLLLNFETLSVS